MQKSPCNYLTLTKSDFINGRYESDSDTTRKLYFRYEKDGAYHLDALDLKTNSRIQVEIVKIFHFDIKDNSISLFAKFHVPTSELIIESEFRVIDSEWLYESWKTNNGTSGEVFWHKVAF